MTLSALRKEIDNSKWLRWKYGTQSSHLILETTIISPARKVKSKYVKRNRKSILKKLTNSLAWPELENEFMISFRWTSNRSSELAIMKIRKKIPEPEMAMDAIIKFKFEKFWTLWTAWKIWKVVCCELKFLINVFELNYLQCCYACYAASHQCELSAKNFKKISI